MGLQREFDDIPDEQVLQHLAAPAVRLARCVIMFIMFRRSNQFEVTLTTIVITVLKIVALKQHSLSQAFRRPPVKLDALPSHRPCPCGPPIKLDPLPLSCCLLLPEYLETFSATLPCGPFDPALLPGFQRVIFVCLK